MTTPRELEMARAVVFDGGGIACPTNPECSKESPCTCCESALKSIALALHSYGNLREDEALEKAIDTARNNFVRRTAHNEH